MNRAGVADSHLIKDIRRRYGHVEGHAGSGLGRALTSKALALAWYAPMFTPPLRTDLPLVSLAALGRIAVVQRRAAGEQGGMVMVGPPLSCSMPRSGSIGLAAMPCWSVPM